MSNPCEYKIRELKHKDYDSYLLLMNEFKKELIPSIFSKKEFINTLEIIKLNATIWVIEHNNEIIASATIIYECKYVNNISIAAHIEDVVVKKTFRGKGLGKLLIEHLIDFANQNKCYKITLNCDNNLCNFFKKNGFNKNGVQMTKYLTNTSNISGKKDADYTFTIQNDAKKGSSFKIFTLFDGSFSRLPEFTNSEKNPMSVDITNAQKGSLTSRSANSSLSSPRSPLITSRFFEIFSKSDSKNNTPRNNGGDKKSTSLCNTPRNKSYCNKNSDISNYDEYMLSISL
jgi:predicted GNAT family N-acyltransferase